MQSSFYNGLGGMKSSQVGIDVWGNNIANGDTTGYKQQNVDFSTLFSNSMYDASSPVSSDMGYSATAATTTMDLSQGNLVSTDNSFDMALNGKGWMAVKDSNGATEYTRTGSFVRDANGELVTQTGDKLQVVNPNNLTFDGNEWKFDPAVPTDNLVTQGATTTSIALPNNITFPAQATTEVKISGNLPNENIAPNPKPAVASNDMGVLYDKNGQNIGLQDSQDVAFGFGNNVSYSDGLVRYDMCISDDEKDGNPVNVDFDVNGQNVKLSLPDGSSAKDISDAIAKDLDDKGILYDKTDNSIQIRDKDGLHIQSNGGDIVTSNSAMDRFVYKTDDNTGNNFTTMQDFVDKLQNDATFTYGTDATVGLDNEGKIYIQNNTDNKELLATSSAASNSNDAFIQNLGSLGNYIRPNTASSSLEFNQNYQGFSGNIIDADGNKNDLKFDFYKTKVDGSNTTWNMTVSEVDADGKVISSTNQDLTFDNVGGLLTPNNVTIDNNGTKTTIDLGQNFTGLTSMDKDNVGFGYSQNGLIDGSLLDYNISDDGKIIANFSNGKSGTVAQIPIYHFQNDQGLDSLGGNKYTPTNNSGQAFLYQSPDGQYISGAQVKNYSLETSNVNMGQAMTELIIIQKAYEANSKSITTSDQMVQKAIDMKR